MLDKPLPILPIVRPTFPPLEAISERFSECLRTGQVTNGGRYVEEFEAALTEYLGVPTIVFSSGMAALVAMLMAEGVNGWDVVCPSFTFCATPHAIKLAGGHPIFADINEETLTLDPEDAERKLTRRTKAILGVDVYGIVCDPMLSNVANRNHVDLMFDSAPAFGAFPLRPDRPKIFSFHATKPFSTMEGGALCSQEASFIAAAKKIRNFGLPGKLGFNGKMSEVAALIGLENLKTFPTHLANRQLAAACLAGCLDGIPGVRWIKPPLNQIPSWCYFPLLIEKTEFGMTRDRLVEMLKTRGIETRVYYPAMHLDPIYWPNQKVKLPVTLRVASQVIALPIYNDMVPGECERVASAIREIQAGG
jgi:dTDP-4-amino-4,6-dideoxygalactose transaminase